MLHGYHVRIARPSDQIQIVADFYIQVLGFHKIGEFKDHDGFDGIMVGHSDAPYHLEFTHQRSMVVGKAPHKDHLLVFYIPDINRWTEIVEKIERSGTACVSSVNPYWDNNGKTYEDPDGYRIVIQNSSWPVEN